MTRGEKPFTATYTTFKTAWPVQTNPKTRSTRQAREGNRVSRSRARLSRSQTPTAASNTFAGCYGFNARHDCNGCFRTCDDNGASLYGGGCNDNVNGADMGGHGHRLRRPAQQHSEPRLVPGDRPPRRFDQHVRLLPGSELERRHVLPNPVRSSRSADPTGGRE